MSGRVVEVRQEEISQGGPPEVESKQTGMKRPWAERAEKKSHWKIIFTVFVQRSYPFYIWSTILPLVSKHTFLGRYRYYCCVILSVCCECYLHNSWCSVCCRS